MFVRDLLDTFISTRFDPELLFKEFDPPLRISAQRNVKMVKHKVSVADMNVAFLQLHASVMHAFLAIPLELREKEGTTLITRHDSEGLLRHFITRQRKLHASHIVAYARKQIRDAEEDFARARSSGRPLPHSLNHKAEKDFLKVLDDQFSPAIKERADVDESEKETSPDTFR